MKSYWTVSAVDWSIFCGTTSSVLVLASRMPKYFTPLELAMISATQAAIVARTPDSANAGEIALIKWVCDKLLTMKQQV